MSLEGIWYSKVGSQLVLEVKGKMITGTFKSTQNPGEACTLYGSVDPDTGQRNRALSFSIAWFDDKGNPVGGTYRSVTSYTGQYHITDAGEVIDTTFLMVDETSISKEYASTYVGHDVFLKNKPI